MIADEVQSGLARSGKMLACDWEDIRPDMVVCYFIFNQFLHGFLFEQNYYIDYISNLESFFERYLGKH